MKRILIPINPQQLITYDDRLDNARVQEDIIEKICCKYVKQIVFFQFPALGIIHLNVNYCFVCGRRLVRGEQLER